jgi:outer membrane protein OmpA-like peptidoglycan-associated protein
MSTDKYLGDTFTVEFDYFPKQGGFEKLIAFLHDGDKEGHVSFGNEVGTGYFENDLSGTFPGHATFQNRWHHAALIVKNGQLKAYQDQYRVLVMPDMGKLKPQSVSFGGIGSPDAPLLFKNVRIANGGGMNMLDQLTKEGKVVTHIQFDLNQAVVKPESMGAIRQIVAALKNDANLKLEIGGHTDSTGDAAKNLSLSEARSEAVKKLIVDQGIDASRLTTKGYGATKPIAPNETPEGKANNRRVEFVKV